ncbi:unnamed protein product, partial [Effrenium voratum]
QRHARSIRRWACWGGEGIWLQIPSRCSPWLPLQRRLCSASAGPALRLRCAPSAPLPPRLRSLCSTPMENGYKVDPSGALSFYGDADGSFTEFMGCGVDLKVAGLGPGKRSNRYSMLVEDGKVTQMFVEEGAGDLKVSDGETMLKSL